MKMAIHQTSEYDTENQFDWERIQYTIEDGVIIATRSLFDAGYEVFGTYEDGDLIQEQFVNTMEALGFEDRSVAYDDMGAISYRGTTYPDAYRINEYFDNGVRSETKLNDGFFGGGVKPWNEVVFAHDADGDIVSRQTKFDDGRIVTDASEQGVRETRQDFLQTKHWETIDTSYDAPGVKSERTTTYDNGIVKQEYFEAGQKARAVQRDNPDTEGDGAKGWSSVDATFD